MTARPRRRLDGIRVIALLKFGKALVLLLTAIGAHQLLRPEVYGWLAQWSGTLDDGIERSYVIRFLDWLAGPGMKAVNQVQWATIAYMLLVLVEGIGLWKHKRWAEWLVVGAGAALIPVELWKLFAPGGNKLLIAVAMALNVTIVTYLALRLWRQPRQA
jgi:uncharacterized membrane protein (DUF2068 family)